MNARTIQIIRDDPGEDIPTAWVVQLLDEREALLEACRAAVAEETHHCPALDEAIAKAEMDTA